MSSAASRSTERYDELLVARAFEGLSPEEAAELDELLEGEDDPAFDLAMAAVDLAHVPARAEPLPERLNASVAAAARAHFAAPAAVAEAAPVAAPVAAAGPELRVALPPAVPANDVVRWSGWALAAACFALAMWSLAGRGGPTGPLPAPGPSATVAAAPSVPVPVPLVEQRARLLAEAKDATLVAWTPTKDPAGQGASGDVVWSDARQIGFMRFQGLAVNDPEKLQYQLWVFDPTQDKRYPVDGGVFDVVASEADPATGDVIVPIVVKLRIKGPTLFAVTVEKPGGVVVSSREHIALVASPKG